MLNKKDNNEELSLAEKTIQDAMNNAWKSFPKGRGFDAFLQVLSARDRLVVAVGTLNYQIGNGGIAQWEQNEFLDFCGDILISSLRKMSGTCLEIAQLVNHFSAQIEKYEQELAEYNTSLNWEDDDDDFECEPELLTGELDDIYYAKSDQFLIEFADFLNQHPSDIAFQNWFDSTPDKELTTLSPTPTKPTVKLSGEDGNIFGIIGRVQRGIKEFDRNYGTSLLEQFNTSLTPLLDREDTTYDAVIQFCMKHVEVW